MREVKIQLSDEARAVLARSAITTDSVKLPEQLDRDLYLEIAKVFKAAGGKWNRGKGLHVFSSDPRALLGLAIAEGAIVDIKRTLQQFFTPAALADEVVKAAQLFDGASVLEPSAGNGALLDAIVRAPQVCEMCAVEIDEALFWGWMRLPGVSKAFNGDFLTCVPSDLGHFDRIIMNPPFQGGRAIEHIEHALKFLKADGLLAAICPNGPREQEKLKPIATIWKRLPPGTLHEAETEVCTALLTISRLSLKRTHGKNGVPDLPASER